MVAAGAHEPQLHGQLGVGVRVAGVQVAAGLLMLPWQAQLGHRLSQGCQPAPGASGPPAQLAGWEGSSEAADRV